MSQKPPMPPDNPTEQAIYWLTWLSSGEANERHRQEFRQWLHKNPTHRAAWKDAQNLWRDISLLDEKDLASETTINPSPIFSTSKRGMGFRFSFALAVCLLLTLIIWKNEASFYLADYRTDIGEQKTLAMADGSIVKLNTDTAISLAYNSSFRRLILHGGEAWFQVAPDPDRPFEVITDYGTVRALGTAFDIDDNGDQITVTVYEHAVNLLLSDGERIEQLPEGSALSFAQSIRNLQHQTDLRQASAWHHQRMVFQNRQLKEVINELNRYRKGQIIIADRQLDDLPLTGVFNTHAPEEALQMIKQSLKLSEYRISDYLVFLYR